MRVRSHSGARKSGTFSGHEEGDAQVDEREANQGAQDKAADEPRFGFGHEAVREKGAAEGAAAAAVSARLYSPD